MSLLLQLVLALAIFAAGAAGGIKWHAGQDAIAAQELAKQQDLERFKKSEKINVAAVKLEKSKESVRAEFVEIERMVDRVVEKPIYRNACFDDDGLRQLNAAITGAGAHSGVTAPAVPASRPTR